MAPEKKSRRPTLRSDETVDLMELGENSRRNNKKDKEEPPPLDKPTDYNYEDEGGLNVLDMLDVACSNLSIVRDFLLGCKENLNRRQTCLMACDITHQTLQRLQVHLAENTVTPTLAEVIRNTVNEALASSVPILSATSAAPRNTNVPTYSSIARTAAPRNSTTGEQDSATKTAPKYKVIVKPADNCKGIQTSADTKRILTSRPPSDFGIRAEKIVLCRDNAIRVESTCPSVLKLGESEEFKKLKLTAQPTTKNWPKVQIFDIPENTTKEQLEATLQEQNLPDSVPETFVRKMFKYGPKQDTGPTTWIVELHPLARQHLINAGRIFSSWRAHKVRDFVAVTRCYLCQGFGHIAKHCISQRVCGYCNGTDHESRNCRHKDDPSQHKCINCRRSQIKEYSHHTASKCCPIYKYRIQDAINETQYDVSDV
jgi:hypothetical protein